MVAGYDVGVHNKERQEADAEDAEEDFSFFTFHRNIHYSFHFYVYVHVQIQRCIQKTYQQDYFLYRRFLRCMCECVHAKDIICTYHNTALRHTFICTLYK